jgi:RNA polymerase sigma factor (sigma-70 family)
LGNDFRHISIAREASIERSPREFIAELFVLHYPSVLRFLSRRMRHEEAADLAQEAFCRLLRHADALRRDSARALLFRTAINLARDAHRRRQSHRVDQHFPIDVHEIAANHPEPAELLFREQARSALERTIARLPADARTVISLRVFQELSCAQIAERLNLSTRTVARKLALILEQVRIIGC